MKFKVGDRVYYNGDIFTIYHVHKVERAGWPHDQWVDARAKGVGDVGTFATNLSLVNDFHGHCDTCTCKGAQ